MTLVVPTRVLEVAMHLLDEGFKRAESYPVERWKKKGWPEDQDFFEAVDACIKLMRAIEKISR